MRSIIGTIALLALSPPLAAQGIGCDTTRYARAAVRQSTPPELSELFRRSGLVRDYEIDVCHLNPFFLRGDFDGDGRADYAIKLRKRTAAEPGRLAVLRGNGAVTWLVPDRLLRYPPATAWYVHPKSDSVGRGISEAKPPLLRGDGIMIAMFETSSALVYWNGTRFVSYWQGD